MSLISTEAPMGQQKPCVELFQLFETQHSHL